MYTFKRKPPQTMEEWVRRYSEAVYVEQWRLKNFAMLFRDKN
ncbi:MAG: hypothetical protein SPK52_02145 [Synergistales bacterium]|nr:hypothetical protein [Bacteroidales bacterium]MDY6434998.1 hypothetical protein [Synergistales bacterium]MDY6393420.1 hypothetical protein [Bacteroidales bacterium]MDY6395354.1 hypothetical protein [Bacteroidales bacterium]MDY6402865.1 hypothetical protein [Bacteroidales bacterium]